MVHIIKVKRVLKEDLKEIVLEDGELALTDAKELFIGLNGKNLKLATALDEDAN